MSRTYLLHIPVPIDVERMQAALSESFPDVPFVLTEIAAVDHEAHPESDSESRLSDAPTIDDVFGIWREDAPPRHPREARTCE